MQGAYESSHLQSRAVSPCLLAFFCIQANKIVRLVCCAADAAACLCDKLKLKLNFEPEEER